ncbi:uncharacterized protein PHALS_01297 [Plasmopara halstedii]|uniref:Uncharacterized protein n=1 Tax=Plasmopara halstedii TaxID=4781 RepID=A0A0P1ATV2_PLAHL|nr:uncharacterized protein PHALS_01297 [Plasmopara halstedii]CEG44974.1 hypothetical protein PHALS_01297 [Plasmopara halstedii]|eukprot:XP_024581343.1 hypothetical protein PHALS_01297 [Plasmopara halstedii]
MSTSDQLSLSLEERSAPVAVEEDAGMLSRFISYFKPSYLWKKLASSWIMRFAKLHIYLRHASEIDVAGNKLFKQVHADKVPELFSSREFQKWSKYFADAFPDDPNMCAQYMVLTLAKHQKTKLVSSIPSTKVVDGKLAFGDFFKVALIDYIAKARSDAKSKPLADDLEKSLLIFSKTLTLNEDSKSIGEQLGREIGISNRKEKLSDVDIPQPVQKFSTQHELISKPLTPLTPAIDNHEATASEPLKVVQLDKVQSEAFDSQKLLSWLKLIKEAKPDESGNYADLSLSGMAKRKIENLFDSLPAAKLVDGKLAFGDRVKDILMNFLAEATPVSNFKGLADHLERSLLKLSENLKADEESKFIGEQLEGEIRVVRIRSNNENIVDVLEHPSVQKWYFSQPTQETVSAGSILAAKLLQQGIKDTKIGVAHLEARSPAAKKIMKEVVYSRLVLNLQVSSDETTIESIDRWICLAIELNADVETVVFPLLKKSISVGSILRICFFVKPSRVDAKAYMEGIHDAVFKSWESIGDEAALKELGLETFYFEELLAREWIDYMISRHSNDANAVMTKILRKNYEDDIADLIVDGKASKYDNYQSLAKALESTQV